MQPRATFPVGGLGWEEIRRAMADMASGDIDFRNGRSPLFVFFNDEETYEIGRKAYFEYFAQNALGGKRAFFGIGKMEEEVIGYGLDLFGAPESAAGVFTSGGSESIFLAVKAARDAHRAAGNRTRPLNLVMPVSAHAGFDKAADVMDIEIRRAPLSQDRRGDVEAMKALIDEDTIMLVGSAPCYPHGVFDRIADIGALAETHGIWLHVDACVGGWIAPFFQRIGRPVPAFDFRVPGVRSISADLHKFGFCPKPASTVFYRHQADMERARFVADAWPSGIFRTSTLVGTRPAGAVAGSWAVLNHLGTTGYEDAARRLAQMVDQYVADISAIEELTFWADPDLTIINFGSETVDINSVAQKMGESGWLPALTRRPEGMHVMLSLFHAPAREAFVHDLREAVEAVKKTGKARTRMEARY